MLPIRRILTAAAFCLIAGSITPLYSREQPPCLNPDCERIIADIYRNTPQLRNLYEQQRNWVFVPLMCREVAPECMLLCVDVGSGVYLYEFCLVKRASGNSWQLLNRAVLGSGTPMQDLRCNIGNDRYHIEILRAGKWVTVFSGNLSEPSPMLPK